MCDNPWEGGRTYTPHAVGELTLDMAFMLLTDIKFLRDGETRATRMTALEAASLNKGGDGKIAGRAADGTPIRGRIGGESLARRLAREAVERRAAAAQATETPRQRRARERAARAERRARK